MRLKNLFKKTIVTIFFICIFSTSYFGDSWRNGDFLQFGQEVQAVATAFEQQWDKQPYSTNQTDIVSNDNGILKLRSITNDPWLEMYNIGSFDPNTYRYIEVRYKVDEGQTSEYQIYYLTTQETNLSEDKNVLARESLIADGQWHTQRLDMWRSSKYKTSGNITGWRYDWATKSDCTIEFDYIKLVSSGTVAFEQQWDKQPYSTNQTNIVSNDNGILKLHSITNDPYLGMYNIGSFDPELYRYIEIRYRIDEETTTGYQIFYLTDKDSVLNEDKVVNYDGLIADGQWHTQRLDMWKNPRYRVSGNITGWRYDWTTKSDCTIEFDYIKLVSSGTVAFEQQWDKQPYSINQTDIVSNDSGILKLHSITNDPYLGMYNIGLFDPELYRYIEIRYRIDEGTTTGYQIYYLTDKDSVLNEDKVVNYDGLIADGQWHTQRLDMWKSPKYRVSGNITGWRYDWTYTSGSTIEFDYIRLVDNNSLMLSASTPTANQVYTSFIPMITVSDIDNDTLTCKYYIDSETTPRDTKTALNTITEQTVGFNALNLSTLSDGIHNIRYEVTDGYISTPVMQTVSFIVDNTAPTIGTVNRTSAINSITISGSATDSFAGLDAAPYRYTIGSEVSAWCTGTTYTSQKQLEPNTKYTAIFEAKDAAGNVDSQSSDIYTKAAVPILEVNNATSYTLNVTTSDNNPEYTQYQIIVSNNNETKYVTQEGTVTATSVWIKLTNKAIRVKGLNPNTEYTFATKARNVSIIETVMSQEVSDTTLVAPAAPPENIIATANDNTITLAWDAVSGATSYDIVVDKNADEINENDIINVTSNGYTQSGFYPDTPHTFLIRSRNGGDPGIWSSKITKSTLPSNPSVPANLNTVSLSNSITVIWGSVLGAAGYDIQYDWDNEDTEKNIVSIGSSTSYVHSSLTPGKAHIYRVRSINAGGKSEWSEPIKAFALFEAVPVPVNIKAEPTENSIILTWDAVEGATGYTIEADGEKYDVSNNTYTQTYLTSSAQPHKYSVRTNKNGRSSDWSSSITAYTLDKFGTPANFKANEDGSSASLSWDTVKDAIKYELERNNETIDYVSETSYIDNGISQNETYTYRIRAISETEVSEWTSPIEMRLYNLSTPKNVTADSDETSISISWDSVNGATAYDVEFDGFTETISATTYSAINLSPGSQYKIRVMARDENGGTSNWSTPLLKSTLFAMGDVPNVSAITKKNSVTVMWNPINGATGYNIEVNGENILNVTGSAITFRDLPAETQYEYRVRALNSIGAGNWSNKLTVYTLPQEPSVPSNVNASDVTSILVTWDKVEGATEYEISITDVKTNEESIIKIGSDNSYLHTGLAPDRTFRYKVMAINNIGSNEWRTEVVKYTLLATPTNLVSTTASSISIGLAWDAVDGATSYDIEKNGELFSGITATKNFFNDLTPNTKHEFRIRAIGENNDSNWSNKISVMTKLDTPTKINKIIKESSIYLSWDEIKDATGYDIEVDGVIEDNASSLFYNNSKLTIGIEHKYRIRAKTSENYSEWSEEIVAIVRPAAPQNLETVPFANDIILTWKSIEGASSYDICIDNTITENVSNTYYKHLNLQSSQTHTYKVRARFLNVEGDWSSEISESTPALNVAVCKVSTNKDKLFNIFVNTSNKQYHEQKTFTVTYNPDEVELVDLCTLTPEKELIAGYITAANLVITKADSGEIVFSLKNPHLLDEDVTGIINVIQFKSKIDGKTSINIQLN